jgi:NAD(P)H dehydrogenase (quinone)
VRAAGHSVEIADLYAEGFDPLLRHADYAQFEHKPMPEDVRREQARVERSDALMFVFPVWWWSFPAMLKGWFDRVWSEGWAYSFTPERSRGLLTYRPVLMLCVAGSRYVTYEKYGYDQAMRTQIDIGVMSYAGLHDVRSQFFYEVDDDPGSHEEHLRLAYDLGKTFLATERA